MDSKAAQGVFDFLSPEAEQVVRASMTLNYVESMTVDRIAKSKANAVEKARNLGRYLRARQRAHNQPEDDNEHRLNDLGRDWNTRLGQQSRIKEHLRRELRALNLAKGFLIGRSYREIENTCRAGNEPSPQEISTALGGLMSPGLVYDWITGGSPEYRVGAVDEEAARAKRLATLRNLLGDAAFLENAPEERVVEFREELSGLES